MVSQLRALLRHLFVYALYLSGGLDRAKKRIRSKGGTLVLTLHRVLPHNERRTTLSPPGMVLSEPTFALLVSYLSTEHQIVPLDAPHSRANLDGRIPVAITFDDGWADNADYAHPILSQHAAPATIFLCPEKMGQNLPFWPEKLTAVFRAARRAQREKQLLDAVAEYATLPLNAHLPEVIEAVKQLPPDRRDFLLERLKQMPFSRAFENSNGPDATMSWETARRLSKSGIAFGSHTLHHEILTHVPGDRAREEVSRSRERVTAELGQPCFALAYPNGNWSPEIRDLAASAGYAVAFANSPGIWSAQTDPFTIPRINLWEGAVTSIQGRFSRPHFDYVVFWKALRGRQD